MAAHPRPYYDEDGTTLRRYSSRSHPYPLSHERDVSSTMGQGLYGSRAHQYRSQDSRNGEHSPGSDRGSDSRPRSRIPVACGRCRKRKIKCSGDDGNGAPCASCKQAGNEQCQFLRVSSQETPMKSEVTGYDFDPSAGAASRFSCRTTPYGVYGAQNPPILLEQFQYRNNPLSNFQYGVKPLYSFPSYPDFTEDVEYGLPTYPLLQSADMALPSGYTPSANSRGWTPGPQVPKNPMFMDQADSTYTSAALPYAGSVLPIRTNVNPEQSKGSSLNGLTVALPTSVVSVDRDRVLPYPAANRQTQIGSFIRTAENMDNSPALGSLQSFNDYNIMQNANMSSNSSTTSDGNSLSPPYLSMSSNSPESVSSSHMSYGSQLSVNHSREIYTPSSSESMYSSTDSPDSSYRHNDGPKRGSHSSPSTTHDGLPSMSSLNTLANGHAYIPWRPGPTIQEVHQLPSPVHRSSISSPINNSINTAISAGAL